MSLSAVKSVTLMLLATAAWKAESAAAPEVPVFEKHAGVRAMEAGFFEGDIVMERLQETGRTATSDDYRLWPEGVMPYIIDYELGATENVKIIRSAMDHIETATCLRFVKRDRERNFVHLLSGQGCYSNVGRIGGQQLLSLGRGCLYPGTVTHELLHAVGFLHEHSRPDRDDYVDIFPENIIKEFLPMFKKVKPREIRLLTEFDYDSVMLYGSDSFSRGPGQPSMLAKNGSRLTDVYNKTGLSILDIRRIKTLYNCT